jgi:hypothetical protein
MLRNEYWERSRELIAWSEDEELKVLGQQASKELDKRSNAYFDRLDKKDAHTKKVELRKDKTKYAKKSIR